MGTMYVIPCTKDMRESLSDIIGKEIKVTVSFDKWNNSLLLEEASS